MPQSFSKMLTHVIFSTKDRYPFFNDKDLRCEMHKFIGGLLNKFESRVIIIGGDVDHVHLFFMLTKNQALSKIIMEIKRESSIWFKSKAIKVSKFSWQRGYAAFTVSQSHCEQLVKYIANQEEHHKKQTFKDEYRAFLIKYNIKFDEQYMWD